MSDEAMTRAIDQLIDAAQHWHHRPKNDGGAALALAQAVARYEELAGESRGLPSWYVL